MTRLSRSQVLGGLLTLVALAAVAMGIFIMGSPADERVRRLDERRVQDLTGIARAVDLYWTRHARLPSTLEELQQEPGGNVSSRDPGTSVPYQYRSLTTTYELCAQFEHDSGQTDGPVRDGLWSHGTGRQCFTREPRKIR